MGVGATIVTALRVGAGEACGSAPLGWADTGAAVGAGSLLAGAGAGSVVAGSSPGASHAATPSVQASMSASAARKPTAVRQLRRWARTGPPPQAHGTGCLTLLPDTTRGPVESFPVRGSSQEDFVSATAWRGLFPRAVDGDGGFGEDGAGDGDAGLGDAHAHAGDARELGQDASGDGFAEGFQQVARRARASRPGRRRRARCNSRCRRRRRTGRRCAGRSARPCRRQSAAPGCAPRRGRRGRRRRSCP